MMPPRREIRVSGFEGAAEHAVEKGMMSITILLADDHDLVRKGFLKLLNEQKDMKVIGEADNGRDAVDRAKELAPDIVVMDVVMPDLNGVDATRQIRRDNPRAKVLALSMNPSQSVVKDMLLAGACGYLPKTCDLEELVEAVRAIAEGETYISREIQEILGPDPVSSENRGRTGSVALLSNREREVLQLVAEGKATKEIAAELHVSVKTVETHRHNIMTKLDLRTIAELTKFAVREGITPP